MISAIFPDTIYVSWERRTMQISRHWRLNSFRYGLRTEENQPNEVRSSLKFPHYSGSKEHYLGYESRWAEVRKQNAERDKNTSDREGVLVRE